MPSLLQCEACLNPEVSQYSSSCEPIHSQVHDLQQTLVDYLWTAATSALRNMRVVHVVRVVRVVRVVH